MFSKRGEQNLTAPDDRKNGSKAQKKKKKKTLQGGGKGAQSGHQPWLEKRGGKRYARMIKKDYCPGGTCSTG